MADRAAAALALLRMVQAGHTVTLERLADLVAEHAAEAGLRDVAVFVVDIRETVLRRLTGKGGDAAGGGQEVSKAAWPARRTGVWTCSPSRRPAG
ncbi:hypothetical protein [Streptomyces misionensis]|uniref:hypothetical protein n=1 Tax=Streptomyces misionensis TaxID=67331 RepID=UPI00094259BA|nr:hypothetical protein [Streptomyces misionensis]